MKKIFLVYILYSFVFIFSAIDVQAQPEKSWIEAREKIKNITNSENRCTRSWEILWPWAKEGNLEARYLLFYLMAPPPEMEPIQAPGNSGNQILSLKDSIIMLSHSLDYEGPFKEMLSEDDIIDFYKFSGFSDNIKLFKCIKNHHKNCSAWAVEANIVPSFEDYAEQIDLFIKKGLKAQCKK